MMVKDEEKNLKRCLESLKPILKGDEVELIVVDTGSKDRTVEIAKQYTNNIFYKPWNYNFSEMRNYTISLAKGEWIFILDADEELEDAKIILKEIEMAEKEGANAINIAVKNLVEENNKQNFVFGFSPRLFRNGFIKYEGAVHNQPIFRTPIYNSKIVIYHYGYIMNDTKLMEYKYKRTVSLLKKELEKDPLNIYYRYQLGVSYSMYGKIREAIEEFRKVYNLLKMENSEMKKGLVVVYGLYANNLLLLGLFDKALEVAEEGLNFNDEYIDLYYIAGLSLYAMGRRQEALVYFKKYMDLFKKLDQIKLLYDARVVFYNISNSYFDNANAMVVQYLLDINNFLEAKVHIEQFKDNKLKLQYRTLLHIKERNFNELFDFYSSCNLEDKEKVSEFIEKYITYFKFDEDERLEIYKKFSESNDFYGKYCCIITKKEKVESAILNIFDSNVFGLLPSFYTKVLFRVAEKKEFLIEALKKVDVMVLRTKIAEALTAKFIDFEDVISLLEVIKPEKADIDILARYIALALLVLLNFPRQSDERLYEIFLNYTENGILLMSKLYKSEEIKEKYRYFLSEEEKYFALMYLIYLSLQEKRMDKSIKYLREAISTMPKLVKHLKRFSKDILGVDVEKLD
ncbi:TPR domain-containing glycosyltransferase [Caldicellulosiruptor naganoensis]|uniref:Glycosyltransferase n=2 Tax=Caldicellulosiruptor naganoensis TaxID=29324 RepID=A0ABY7BGG9_9FIRM|nr:TPR domain-containing glycosyltransferase [Caldicellulosiruptor naganoensis]WAM30840.1 glycosyltransferase [Caldicellulosiruptor naganoensis]